MALQYFTGFEDGTLVGMSPLNSPTNVTTDPRSGARHLHLSGTADQVSFPLPTNLATVTDDIIVGFGFQAVNFNDATAYAAIQHGPGTAYVRLHFRINGTVFVDVDNALTSAGTEVGASVAGVVTVGQWHYIEWRTRFSDTVGQVEVYVDGTQVINESGLDTIAAGPTEVARTLIFRTPSASADPYYDDVYMLDPTGESSPYDTFLGPVEIERLAPDGDSLITDWTATTGDTTKWTEIEEVPVTNTENVHTLATGSDLRMTIGNRTHTGTILGVKPHAVATLDQGVAAKNLAPFMRADPGGTPTDSTKTGNALAVGDGEAFNIVSLDPDTAAAWTSSGLNAAELGFEVVA